MSLTPEERAFALAHHAWEYPEGVAMEDVDRGVRAVFEALRAQPWTPKGLPGEILSVRALVGIVLADAQAAEKVPQHVDHTDDTADCPACQPPAPTRPLTAAERAFLAVDEQEGYGARLRRGEPVTIVVHHEPVVDLAGALRRTLEDAARDRRERHGR